VTIPEGEIPPRREPVFKAPWPSMTLVGALLGAYALQVFVLGEAAYQAFGFSPAGLETGGWPGLFTALFVHGNLAHVLMNTAGALAFGAPVARLLGVRGLGPVVFFAFFLVCGALANYGFARLHPGADVLLVGASGSVFGLIGAATRILAGRGGLAPVFAPRVLAMTAAWIGLNLVVGLLGASPGLDAGQAVAWEAHVFGFLAGLLLIGPAVWIARRGQGARA